MRRQLPILVTVVVGLFMTVSYFLNLPAIQGAKEELTNWGLVVAAFAVVLGVANLFRVNYRHVAARREDWPYKLVLVISLVVVLVIGLAERLLPGLLFLGTRTAIGVSLPETGGVPDLARSALAASADVFAGGIGPGTTTYYTFTYVITPLGATMFALLAFFVASAAFRAFRARNLEATLLLVSGCVVMLGRVPLGARLGIHLPEMQQWIMQYPNAAGQRAIIVGAAMGAVAAGLRIILGFEKPYLQG